jgi:hypothetical protein
LQLPESARHSRQGLMQFANTLISKPAATANTKLEFVTLRIFPFRKITSTFLHELRALPPKKLRLANIELPKSDAWAHRQREKGIFKRMYEVISEPRYKFYVKDGRTYTMRTGVPGVWEAVAERIQAQTIESKPQSKTGFRKPALALKASPPVIAKERLKRQTARGVGR